MTNNKSVKVVVGVDVEDSEVDALEKKLGQQHSTTVNVKEQGLRQRLQELEDLKAEMQSSGEWGFNVDSSKVGREIAQIKRQLDEVDDEPIKPQVDSTSAQLGIQNISQGISQAKEGISGLAQNVQEVQQAGMQSEQNLGFLANNVGGMEKARDVMKDINDIVASMPGDDNTMRSVLSTAQALGNDLNPDEMRAATATMADYMQGSATMGKQAIESQQDIMKYLLDGNTAELERGSIVSSRVDKLKEATTFQERQAAMQEVLNELGYGGIAGLDTTINKQAEWEGMLYNSQDALSSMWLGAEKGAMDYILKLNEGTNGLAGMALVAAQMATGPLFDVMTGIGQITTGLKGLKDAAKLAGVTKKLGALKKSLMEVGTKAKSAALSMLDLGKKALIAGYNALKSAAMWVAQKVQLVASTLATYAMAAAQALLNIVMSMNPIMLVVIAIVALIAVLVYLYYNVDSVRQVIDNLGQSIIQTAQWIYNGFMSIVSTIGSALSNAWSTVSQFVGNLVSGLVNGASNAVNGFMNWIRQIPTMVYQEFQRTLQLVSDFISSIPQRVWEMGAAVVDALKKSLGIGSPGHMFYMVEGEFNRIDDLTKKTNFDTGAIGQGMVDSFSPSLNSEGVGTSGNNITINIESVDSQERINQIVQAVEDALKFDNLKAGRTV